MLRHTFLLFAWIGYFISSFVVAAPSRQTPSPSPAVARASIVGAWLLNRDLSDQPGQMGPRGGDTGRRGAGGGGGRGGRGGFGGRGGMRGGNRGGDAGDRARLTAAIRDAVTPPARVTIVQHDAGVSFTDGDGRVLKLTVNGKKEKHLVGTETVEIKAKWDGANLVVETAAGGGAKIVKTYTVASGEGVRQLRVLVKVQGPRMGSREIKQVYDPVE